MGDPLEVLRPVELKVPDGRKVKKLPRRALSVVRSPILGSREFSPTNLQIQFMQIYLKRLENGEDVNPSYILKYDLRRNIQNWWNWKKNYGFTQWFMKCKEAYHTGLGLANVHTATYKHALKESPADRKLYLERFDDKYKPKTGQEFTFVGARPKDGEEAKINEEDILARSRKLVESQERVI